MKTEHLLTGGIPAVLYGSAAAARPWGSAGTGGGELLPWTAVPEIQTALDWAGRRWESVSPAGQQHRGLSRNAGLGGSGPRPVGLPILDMEELIRTMMGWAGVTEEELRARERSPPPSARPCPGST